MNSLQITSGPWSQEVTVPEATPARQVVQLASDLAVGPIPFQAVSCWPLKEPWLRRSRVPHVLEQKKLPIVCRISLRPAWEAPAVLLDINCWPTSLLYVHYVQSQSQKIGFNWGYFNFLVVVMESCDYPTTNKN